VPGAGRVGGCRRLGRPTTADRWRRRAWRPPRGRKAAAQTRAEHTTEPRQSTSRPAARFPHRHAGSCRASGRPRPPWKFRSRAPNPRSWPCGGCRPYGWNLWTGRWWVAGASCCGCSVSMSAPAISIFGVGRHRPGRTSLVFPNERAARLQAARRWIWPSASELAGSEVELVHVAVGADMEGDVDTVGLAASTDDLPLGRDVAGPVLVLTLKLAPNHTAPTMRNVEVPLLATTPRAWRCR
jgi:hypothetical protein